MATYTDSSLATYTNIASSCNHPRNHAIDTITIHCVVGQWTAKKICDYFVANGVKNQNSCNYGVGYDGSIGLCVHEEDRSWCSSSATNDHRAITIETASDTTSPYAITDAAYNALIKLCADICQRNGIKKLVWSTSKTKRVNHTDGVNMTCHRDFANKSCPGDYIYEREGDIAAAVNAILNGESTDTDSGTTSSGTISVGDEVYYNGGNSYKSSTASSAANSSTSAGYAQVTKIASGKNNPYHLIGSKASSTPKSGVYGWVRESSIKTATKSVTATGVAKSKDTSLKGTYKVTASDGLALRNDAETSSKLLVTLPKNTKVKNYGYYTQDPDVSTTKWLYVAVTYNSVDYVGFCSSAYLSKC